MRWPRGEGASTGRSRCDGCGKALSATELVPLLSYVVRRGRCRSCDARIDPEHFRVELAAALIGLVALSLFPLAKGLGWAVMCWTLLPMAILDWRHLWLPDRLNMALALGGLLLGGLLSGMTLTNRAVGGVVGFVTLAAIAWMFAKLTGRRGLGSGDPKMFGALGLWFGWGALPMLVVLACLVGFAFVAVARGHSGKTTGSSYLPFGTMLAFAAAALPLAEMLWWNGPLILPG